MKKPSTKKHMTNEQLAETLSARIDDLAVMTANGFASLQTEMDARFAKVDESFIAIRRDILSIMDGHTDHERRITTLEHRMGI
jgi:hypothetical protein